MWEQIKDKFLLACGNSYANGSIGGEATHKLIVSEMPSHVHGLAVNGASWGKEQASARNWLPNTWSKVWETITFPMDGVGGNQPHNNMPPYLAIYVWKRIS